MNCARWILVATALLLPGQAPAQIPGSTPPVPPPPATPATPVTPAPEMESAPPLTAGSLEVQVGVAGVVLPEASDGTFSAQPELRVGLFLRDRVELQGEVSLRVWPLGVVAANSIGVSGNLLYYLGSPQDRARVFILGGAGGAFADPPGLAEGRSFDPLVRGGVGLRVPLAGLGVPILNPVTFLVEYRGELVFPDESDFVSGISLGVSRFL